MALRFRGSEWRKYLGHLILGITIFGLVSAKEAGAQDKDTLRVVSTQQISVLDAASPSRTLAGFGLAMMVYDRLITFELDPSGDGFQTSNLSKVKGELAASWSLSDDKKTITFNLRPDAKFHDGSPVTADDVVWSIHRAIALPVSKEVFRSTGFSDPKQISAVDPFTVKVTLDAPNELSLLIFASPLAPIINADAAKEHATPEDPWSVKWLEQNAAGGGAFKVSAFRTNEQVQYERFDDWKSGELPYFQRIVYQVVPEPLAIVTLLERGSADLSIDVPLKDHPTITERGQVKTGSVSISNGFEFLALNTQSEKLADRRVRQALAYSVPYADIYAAVYQKTGTMLNCQPATENVEPVYPQAYPYCTDHEKAKALLAEAGYPDGLELTLTYDTARSTVFEPIAVLMKDSFQKSGITLDIQKLVGAQFAELTAAHKLDFFLHSVTAWFGGVPNYWFSAFFQGPARDNFGFYKNEKLSELVNEVSGSTDEQANNERILTMIGMVKEDLPILPLRLRTVDVVMAEDLVGFTGWFHGALDLRQLRRAE